MLKIPIKIYPYTVYFCHTLTYNQYKKKIKRLGYTCTTTESYFDSIYGLTSCYNQDIVIYVKTKPAKSNELSMISHEVLHAVIYIMKEVGMVLSYDSEEAYCYLLSYLTEQIYDYLKYYD